MRADLGAVGEREPVWSKSVVGNSPGGGVRLVSDLHLFLYSSKSSLQAHPELSSRPPAAARPPPHSISRSQVLSSSHSSCYHNLQLQQAFFGDPPDKDDREASRLVKQAGKS